MTNTSEPPDDTTPGESGQELADLEAAWDLPSPLWRCAHCRDRITGAGYTWFGPLPEPGQDRDQVPRYHIDRDPCRIAGGWEPMAAKPTRPGRPAAEQDR